MSQGRLFELLCLLLERGRMTAGELAEHFEVSVRTIYRDVDALSDAIYALITYPALAKMFAEKGLDEVTGLKWDNAAAKIKAVYQAVIDEAAARQRE